MNEEVFNFIKILSSMAPSACTSRGTSRILKWTFKFKKLLLTSKTKLKSLALLLEVTAKIVIELCVAIATVIFP